MVPLSAREWGGVCQAPKRNSRRAFSNRILRASEAETKLKCSSQSFCAVLKLSSRRTQAAPDEPVRAERVVGLARKRPEIAMRERFADEYCRPDTFRMMLGTLQASVIWLNSDGVLIAVSFLAVDSGVAEMVNDYVRVFVLGRELSDVPCKPGHDMRLYPEMHVSDGLPDFARVRIEQIAVSDSSAGSRALPGVAHAVDTQAEKLIRGTQPRAAGIGLVFPAGWCRAERCPSEIPFGAFRRVYSR